MQDHWDNSRPEEDLAFSCPYCMIEQTVRVDISGGSSQRFVVDCENCCRPIEVEADMETDGSFYIIVKREGEG